MRSRKRTSRDPDAGWPVSLLNGRDEHGVGINARDAYTDSQLAHSAEQMPTQGAVPPMEVYGREARIRKVSTPFLTWLYS